MVNLCSVYQDCWGTSNLSLNPDASPAALRAVRSAPVSLVR
jgi:MOSC domain-containing protein YiiM